MSRTVGAYMTRGRALELERRIASLERDVGERVAAIEAEAHAARETATAIYNALVSLAARRNPGGEPL